MGSIPLIISGAAGPREMVGSAGENEVAVWPKAKKRPSEAVARTGLEPRAAHVFRYFYRAVPRAMARHE